MKKDRNSFTGSIGFVIAAAASAVGLGNIWRFPYLAARDGGGLFLVVYLVLALTFGFTLLITEVAIGRMTRESPLTAYGVLCKKAGFIGVLGCVVPMLILPYYCAIGGWVLKYFLVFLCGEGRSAASEEYFGDFISSTGEPVLMMALFLVITVVIVLGGVDRGIEKFSRIIMPLLIVLILLISIYSLTLVNVSDSGEVRTGMEGLRILVVPSFEGMTFSGFMTVVMDAMGQLFYSLSVAMGIMIAYGSYMKDETNLPASVGQIEIFDTGIAFLAGVMIIPAVYVFMGKEGMEASGPGLMFKSLPRVFLRMGRIGNVVGALFFAMVLFAAITSSVSILEAIVSSFMDRFRMSRRGAALTEGAIAAVMAVIVCFGYNYLYFELPLPNGTTAQILDVMDYVSNNLLMPIVSIGTCILAGWIVGPERILEEVIKNGEGFRRRYLYVYMIRFIAPIMLLALLLKAFGIL